MNYLLDTNIVSEGMRRQPEPRVSAWLAGIDEDRIYISSIVLAELRLGVERMPAGQRRTRLEDWILHDLLTRFATRILTIDNSAADTWGRISAYRFNIGRPIGVMDAFHAAIACSHQMTLVTRNMKDFAELGLTLVNPWENHIPERPSA